MRAMRVVAKVTNAALSIVVMTSLILLLAWLIATPTGVLR